MAHLRDGEETTLGQFGGTVGPEFFTDTVFRLSSARSATFVLLLASLEPRSFISGNKVALAAVLQAYNRHEFHHMYPRALLKDDGVEAGAINCLANMCILSRADNNAIRRKRPSEYRLLMPEGDDLTAILRGAAASESLFSDDFVAFMSERAHTLADIAQALLN